MFTVETRVNGALVATLHVQNIGLSSLCDEKSALYHYEYEYYEPDVGVSKLDEKIEPHIQGSVICRRDKGIRHVIQQIFQDINLRSKPQG